MDKIKNKKEFSGLKALTILIVLGALIFIVKSGYLENSLLKTKNMKIILIGTISFLITLIILWSLKKRNKLGEENEGNDKEKEMRLFLKIVDSLFEKLPDNVISVFSKSEDFKIYKKIMRRYNI